MNKSILLLALFQIINASSQAENCESEIKIFEDFNTIAKCKIKPIRKDLQLTNRQSGAVRFLKKRNFEYSKKSARIKKKYYRSKKNILYSKNFRKKNLGLKNINKTTSLKDVLLFSACENTRKDQISKCFNTQIYKRIQKYLYRTIEVSQIGTNGNIKIEFTVNKKGKVINVNANGNKNAEFIEQSALELVKSLPAFIPSISNGKKINVKYVLPIHFES